MELFQKKSNYLLFFCGLLISAVMPDRLTSQISAEPGLCYGIKTVFTGDPLWTMLPVQTKQFIADSPVRKAMWNCCLKLRQYIFEQFAITLGLTKKEVTVSVKKMIYEAMGKRGMFFNPVNYPGLFKFFRDKTLSPIERNKEYDYYILFAKNGVITSISSASLPRNFKVNSSIFDQKNGSSLIAFNQLENFLVRNGIEVSDYGVTRVASFMHSTFKDYSLRAQYSQKDCREMFRRGFNSLIKNQCYLLLHVDETGTSTDHRLSYKPEVLKDINRCLAVIDCLTLTPNLQQQLEGCIGVILTTNRQAEKLFKEGKEAAAESLVDAQVSYIMSNLQDIVKRASGYNANAIEFMKTSDVWGVAEFIDWIDEIPLLF